MQPTSLQAIPEVLIVGFTRTCDCLAQCNIVSTRDQPWHTSRTNF